MDRLEQKKQEVDVLSTEELEVHLARGVHGADYVQTASVVVLR